jgi:hypothetical protein
MSWLRLNLHQSTAVLTGKRFKLSRATIGIQLVDGETSVVKLPTDSVIDVLSGPNANGKVHEKGIVYVVWEENTVAMFAVDIEARGTEIRDKSATA